MTYDVQMQEQQEDQRLLRDSVARLFERAGGVERARKLRDQNRKLDQELWHELAQAGLLGLLVPGASGGQGMGLPAAGIVAEEMGRVLAPEPFIPVAVLAAGLLSRCVPDHELLAALVGAKKLPAVAWQERGMRGPTDAIATRLTGGRLQGAKAWVAGAGEANALLVIAQIESTPGGDTGAQSEPELALCLVNGSDLAVVDGLTLQEIRQADGNSLYEITLANVAAEVLAAGPKVGEAIAAAVDEATALTAAELLGLSGEALALTLEFLKTREQFGRPIGSFQALQHRVVDLHMAYEIAQAGVHEALALMEVASHGDERARQSSRAKARAGDVALKITREAIQLHGAIGYADECNIGLFLNRALVLSAAFGEASWHRRRWFALRQKRGRAA